MRRMLLLRTAGDTGHRDNTGGRLRCSDFSGPSSPVRCGCACQTHHARTRPGRSHRHYPGRYRRIGFCDLAGPYARLVSRRPERAAINSKFLAAGLGPHVQSLVGTGETVPVSGDQVAQAFSPEQIEGWATQAGTTLDAVKDVPAQALPRMADHLTTGGAVPADTSEMPDLSGLLARFMGGARPA